MSYFEGLSCPVCTKPFTSDEDIVVCPQCGLPHHRACWKSVGRCFAHEKHGTSEQWSRDKAQAHATPVSETNVCPHCAAINAQYAEFCSRCGHPLSATEWHSTPTQTPPPVQVYVPYRAPEEKEIKESFSSSEKIDGAAADELAAIVGNNADYYVDRFRRIAQGGFGGWNWAAFLLTPFWLFYRKQYLLGAVYFCVLIPAMFAFLTLYAVLPTVMETASVPMTDMVVELEKYSFFIPCTLIINIYVALMLLLALKGNSFYFAQCKKKIRTVKAKTPDISASELGTFGGTSVGVAILFLSVWYFAISALAAPLIELLM